MAIKDVFDKFENDDFIAAKDELSAMMQDMTNKYIKIGSLYLSILYRSKILYFN